MRGHHHLFKHGLHFRPFAPSVLIAIDSAVTETSADTHAFASSHNWRLMRSLSLECRSRLEIAFSEFRATGPLRFRPQCLQRTQLVADPHRWFGEKVRTGQARCSGWVRGRWLVSRDAPLAVIYDVIRPDAPQIRRRASSCPMSRAAIYPVGAVPTSESCHPIVLS